MDYETRTGLPVRSVGAVRVHYFRICVHTRLESSGQIYGGIVTRNFFADFFQFFRMFFEKNSKIFWIFFNLFHQFFFEFLEKNDF